MFTGLAEILVGPTLRDSLDYWHAYVEWAGDGDPLGALSDAIDWCFANQPRSDTNRSVLLWGDPRLATLSSMPAGVCTRYFRLGPGRRWPTRG